MATVFEKGSHRHKYKQLSVPQTFPFFLGRFLSIWTRRLLSKRESMAPLHPPISPHRTHKQCTGVHGEYHHHLGRRHGRTHPCPRLSPQLQRQLIHSGMAAPHKFRPYPKTSPRSLLPSSRSPPHQTRKHTTLPAPAGQTQHHRRPPLTMAFLTTVELTIFLR